MSREVVLRRRVVRTNNTYLHKHQQMGVDKVLELGIRRWRMVFAKAFVLAAVGCV